MTDFNPEMPGQPPELAVTPRPSWPFVLSGKHYGSAWEGAVRVEMSRVATALRTAGPRIAVDHVLGEIAERVEAGLAEADAILASHRSRSWIFRLGRAGRTYELALAAVLEAGEDVILVADFNAVLAQIPVLRASVKAYLGAEDPRTEAFLRYCEGLMPASLAGTHVE